MVEEKARSLLPRHNFASLSYYINEYGSRGMTIDAFVSVLLEMLDTPEKVSVCLTLMIMSSNLMPVSNRFLISFPSIHL